MKDLEDIKTHLQVFAEDRDWDQFHSPKNLSMEMSVEVAELVEHFQWIKEEQSAQLDDETLAEVADKLDVDILSTVEEKINKNEAKFPIYRVKGSSKKYMEYDNE